MIALCYEVLDKLDFRITNGKLTLYEGVPHFETGIPSEKYKQIVGYYEETICEWCGTDYLKKLNIKHNCCSDECKKNLAGWHKEWKYKEERIKSKWNKAKRSYRGNLTRIAKEAKSEQRLKTHIGPLYDNYIEVLSPYYEIRRSLDDADFLEVRCAYCNEWFKPSKEQVQNVLPFIKGNNTKKYSTTFYCKPEHAKELKIKLTAIKNKWKSYKKLEDMDEELLLLPEIEQRRRYFKKNGKNRDIYLRSIYNTYKTYKIPTDPDERYFYLLERNKEHFEKMKKTNPRKLKIRRIFYYSKVRAKEKGLEHTITKEWLKEQLKTNKCELTGLPFSYDLDVPRNPYGPSIDRINITKGYTPENCRMVLWAVNAGLGHYTEKDLYRICKAYLLKHNLTN